MKHFFVTKWLMIAGGFWKLKLEFLNDRQWLYYRFYCAFLQIYYTLLLLGMYAGVIEIWYLQKSQTMDSVGLMVFCTIIFLKAIMCQRRGITKIIQDAITFDKESIKFDEEDLEIYKSYSKFTTYLILTLFTCSSLCGTTLVGCKFVIYIQKKEAVLGFANITEIERPLPYMIWRPTILKEHYFAAFSLDILSAIIGCTFNTITQALYISVMTFMISKLNMLQNKFRNYGKMFTNEVSFVEKFISLRDLILQHKNIIMVIEELDENLSYLLLVEFSINSFQITTFLFEILSEEVDPMIVFRLNMLFCMVLQVFVLAWLASEIQKNSMGISQAIYECKWYDIPEQLKQYLIIIMVRAQRPLTISIGPFFVLTNSTAVTTVKAAYSYLALLNRKKYT